MTENRDTTWHAPELTEEEKLSRAANAAAQAARVAGWRERYGSESPPAHDPEIGDPANRLHQEIDRAAEAEKK